MSHSIPKALLTELESKLKNDTFFITGGTGFFGRSFLEFLLEYEVFDADITILARNPSLFLENYTQFQKLSGLKFVVGDVQDFAFPNKAFDHIIHLATPASASLNLSEPTLMADIIVTGTKRILELAKLCGSKNVLLASSGAVYGRQPTEISHIPETYLGAPIVTAPGSAYGEAKRFAELLGCEYARNNAFHFKIARCFAFVGPHLDQSGSFAIGNFIRDAKKNNAIEISGDGTPLRSYMYSKDLIVWLLKILFSGKNLTAFNVGSDQSISIAELAERVVAVTNPGLEIKIKLQKDTSKPLEQYVPSVEKAKRELGLEVWTDLITAIKESAK